MSPVVGLLIVPLVLIVAVCFFVGAQERERPSRAGLSGAFYVVNRPVLIVIAAIVVLWGAATVVFMITGL